MIEYVSLEHAQELDEFVRSSPYGHFMQTSAYGRLRSDWMWQAVVCRAADGSIRGSMSLLLHRLHGIGQQLAYAPRGPVCAAADTATFMELLDGARRFARQQRGYLLRIDPPVSVHDSAFAQKATELGFHISRQADFGTFQPKNVYLLPLAGKDEQMLLAQMHAKTRYNLRLAERRGVTVREGSVMQIPAFYALLCQTGARDGFAVRPQAYYERFLQFIPGAKLFLAEQNGTLLAGAIGVQMGIRTWYVYGASANAGRQDKPNELLQWTMIRWALAGGCSLYDFRGVEGEPIPSSPQFGLHRFKMGFGSEFTAYVGQMDLQLRPLTCELVKAVSAVRRLPVLLRGTAAV